MSYDNESNLEAAPRTISRSNFYSGTNPAYKKGKRCRKCKSLLSQSNPYHFCNACIAKASQFIIGHLTQDARERLCPRSRLTENNLQMMALRYLGTAKTRKPLKMPKDRFSLNDRIAEED